MKNKIYYAYQLNAYFKAGLTMTEVDGKLGWLGENKQIEEANRIMNEHELK